ncbi:hypothetical protein HA402_009664 [Bradysia odoriphaga]|nr:hypothetical protein HA402_009664 [Bradysia odoriphaga]
MDSQLCRLCLQNSDDTVNIWKTYQDSTIAIILAKHFWFLQVHSNDGLTEWLCQVCWAQTKNFHEFYQKVEDFQKSYWDSTKNKNDGDDIDENVVADTAADVDPESATETTEFELEAMDSQVSQKDDSNYDCEEGSTVSNGKPIDQTPRISNDGSKPVEPTPQADDNGKTVFRLKGVSVRQSEEQVNKTIREEQNRELNGQIREWFTLKCELCSAGDFDTLLAVKRHYRKEHQTTGYLKCCDQKFYSRCDLLDHIRYHILYPDAPKVNAEIYEWFTMKCDICTDVTFKTLLDIRRHYRGVHNVRGYLTCCNKKFNTRQAMVAHMRSHTNPDANHCEQCNRSFSTKQSLKNHIAHHVPLDSRAFKCTLCSSSFAREAILKYHVKIKHTAKNGQKFPCEKCNRSYQSEFLLKCHIRQFHETFPDYVCEVCARQFKSKHTLRNHFTSEHSTKPQPRVQCDICGNWLKNEYNLNRHVNEKHKDNKPTKCNICDKVYPGKVRLRKHISYVHGEKKYRCTLCEKPFHSPFALKTIENVVNIWETFQHSTIATILAKHFWFQIKKNDGLTEWLCKVCWEQTKAFHEFYERVEQFQKSYWESIKSDGGGNDETIVIEPDLTIVKCEETELTLQVIDSQLNEEDDSDYNDDDTSKTPQTSSDNSQSSDKPSQRDYNRKVSTGRDISSFSQSDKVTNQKIREEQNKELNGQIREWFTMKCDICDEDEFDTWYGVKRHYRNVHQTIGYLKCCDQKFHRRCKLLDHIRQHIVTPESSKLNDQIREFYSMKCDICPDVPFGTLVDMRRHYREVHKMHGYLICCGNKFNRRHAIIAHMRCHTNPDEYRCEQCGKTFTTSKALKNHIDNHVPLDSRAFKCDLCTSSFAKAATLRRHVQDKHTSKNGEKFPCEKCKKNYRSELLLKCHIRQTHDTLHNFVCEICARQFKSKQTLQKHVFCEHSTTPRPKVQCNICGNWYKNEYGLAKHMTEQHRHTDPVNCPVCNKVCPTKHRLNQHLRSAHAERKHECVLCNKAFRGPKNLKEHVATHTGEDLYKCQYCDKKFKSSANMYSHLKKAHLEEWTQEKEKKASMDMNVVTDVEK